MAKLTKIQISNLSNTKLAIETGVSESKVETAFNNYNKLLDVMKQSKLNEKQATELFLSRTELKDRRDIDIKLASIMLEKGKLERSFAELASIKGISIGTIKSLIDAMQSIDISEQGIDTDKTSLEKIKKNRTPRAHYEGLKSLSVLSDFGLQLTSANGSRDSSIDKFFSLDDLIEELEKIKDLVEEGKDITEAGKDILDNLKKAKEIIEGQKKKGNATQPRDDKGGVSSGDQDSEEIKTNIEEDEYYDLYEEALSTEPLYSVWLDRLMAFEVDGAGDDNVFWTSQITVYLNNPRRIIRSSFISKVYDIDEREEYRLKPKDPISGKRSKPLPDKDWDIRGFIDKSDASFALRVNGLSRGIPLSKLDKIEIDVYLYESDSVNQLIEAVAAIGAAAIAALGIIKGKFTAPKGSTQEASDALERGLKKLNKLINSDDLILSDSFIFKKEHFEEAFKKGQIFPVKRGAAAIGLPFQRVAEAELETDDVMDTESLDSYLKDNMPSDKKKLRDFLEDKFESYYELRLRFEKEEPSK